MKPGGDFLGQSREMSGSTPIRGSEKTSVAGAWLALLLPLGIGAMFFGWGHMPLFMKTGISNPIAVIIVLVGLIILGRALWETLRLSRFGDPVLDLVHVPVPLGGTVEGRITLAPRMTTAPDFSLKLQCIRRVLQQGPKNSRWVETVLWTGEKSVSLLPGAMVPVSMEIPPDQQETNSTNLTDQILWRLTVTAPFRGPSFLEKYAIPVKGRTAAARRISELRESTAGSPQVTGKKAFLATLPFLIGGLAIFAGGLYLLSLGISDLKKAAASTGWPTAPGQIRTSLAPHGNALFVGRTDSDFTYTFQVKGTNYLGDTVFPHILWRRAEALKMARAYPPGFPVTVHYSPADPETSCLVAGVSVGAGQRLVLALIVLTFGFLLVAAAAFAPRDAVMTGNTFTFRQGSTGSRVMGYSFLTLIVSLIALWWVT